MTICVFIGCQTDKELSLAFKEFTTQINNVSLPIIISCRFQLTPKDQASIEFLRFVPKSYEVAAKFNADNEIQVLLFNSKLKSTGSRLYSFNAQGESIDSLQLSLCTSTARVDRMGSTVIDTNLFITITDTLKHYTYMQHGFEYIRNMDSVIHEIQILQVNDSGKFETQRTSKKRIQ